MAKLKGVCGFALALAVSAAGCSDSDEASTGDAGASGAGRAGSAGVSGKGGGPAEAGSTSDAGDANEPAQGGAAGSTSAAGGSSGSDNDSNPEGGALGIGDCLPDGTELQVTASGSSAYVFTGLPEDRSDGEENVHLALCRSYTYTFVLNAAGHPFYFKTDASLGTADAYDTGVTNNGSASGTISWTLAGTTPGLLYYQCSLHQAMGGEITVVEPP